MKIPFTFIKIINIVALLFLLLGGFGLAITGFLQVIAAILFFLEYPKNKLIHIYFSLVIIFFIIWDRNSIDWLFAIPIFLLFFLTYIIHFQKK